MDTCITAQNIDEIKRRAAFLETEYAVKFLSTLKIGSNHIIISFKRGLPIKLNVHDFIYYANEISSLKIIDDSTVRTNCIRQTALDYTNSGYDQIVFNDSFVGKNLKVRIISSPLLIGCVNNKEEWGKYDTGSPCTPINAIEFMYSSKDEVLSPEQENDIIQGILFNISDKYNRPFTVGLRDVRKYKYSIQLNLSSNKYTYSQTDIASLPHYSPMFDFYTQALHIKNDEIKFLYFYKLIEFISPAVAKIKLYEELCRVLPTGNLTIGNCNNLDSILSLTHTFDKSIKDSELAKTVMAQCDIRKLYEFLPDWVKERCPQEKKLREQQSGIDITTKRESSIKNKVAAILYATRNSIVHAKANYEPTGDECPKEELNQLNVFMRKFCKDLIFWKEKHPELPMKK